MSLDLDVAIRFMFVFDFKRLNIILIDHVGIGIILWWLILNIALFALIQISSTGISSNSIALSDDYNVNDK